MNIVSGLVRDGCLKLPIVRRKERVPSWPTTRTQNVHVGTVADRIRVQNLVGIGSRYQILASRSTRRRRSVSWPPLWLSRQSATRNCSRRKRGKTPNSKKFKEGADESFRPTPPGGGDGRVDFMTREGGDDDHQNSLTIRTAGIYSIIWNAKEERR